MGRGTDEKEGVAIRPNVNESVLGVNGGLDVKKIYSGGNVEDDEETTALDHHSITSAPPALLLQIVATGVIAMTQLDIGAVFAFPGVTLPHLLDPNSGDVPFTTGEAALFASVVYLGAMIGSVLAGLPMVRFGQRVTMLIALPFSFTMWVSLYFASTQWLIVTLRFLQGLSMSLLANSSTTYVAELAHSSVRGRLMSFLDLFRQLGSLFAFVLGTSVLTWREMSLTCAFTFTVVPFIALLFLPNSPRWLASHNRTKEALRSLVLFRGPRYDSENEMKSIIAQFSNSKQQMKAWKQLRLLKDRSILRYVVIMAFVLFMVHFNGISVIPAYIVIIMNEANITMSSYLAALIVALTKVAGTCFFTLVIDRVDRKPLFAGATLVCALSFGLLGGYFFDQTHKGYLQGQDWLPILSLAVAAFFSSSPVISLLRSELFPTSVRSVVVPILYVFFFIGAFISLQTFSYLENGLGSYGAFWLFMASNILSIIVVLTTIPETRGKTLEQITETQRTRSRSRSTRIK